ncbi:MAG: 2-hexaprenyl-6-methoxy-1,4-benzoquinone methyltransferase [Thelocarpon impressellum]|nr:MAG: 2-hexaprenyl-6-methoxy-1,4-benzoquinone methyltransferase [Thelocarpon impressellum]
MNDLMSLGIHRLWKDDFVRGMNPGSPSSSQPWKILDIAGGTGDIAFRLLEHARLVHGDTRTSVTVADINPNMLAEGRKRAQATSYAPPSAQLDFVEANAETLPDIPSDSIDLYTVAFGIRNFTDKPRALREAYRVLKPGGVFACLEFGGGGGESSGGAASGAGGGVTNPVLRAAYARWSFSAIPLLGQLVAADRDSYQYLVESIARFPSQSQFRDMIRDAGFLVPGGAEESGGWTDLTGGIAAVHKGVKPVR